MTHNLCDQCETVKHCSQHGCIPKQPLKPCRSPYCECTPGTCGHPGCYDARGEQFKHPAPAEKPYTAVRNAWTGKVTYTCNTCHETDFRSEHAARFHICEPPTQPAPVQSVQEPVAMTFDEAWASLSWQEWRTKSPKELFAELHRLTTPPAQPAPDTQRHNDYIAGFNEGYDRAENNARKTTPPTHTASTSTAYSRLA
jgi:hypothetical protein